MTICSIHSVHVFFFCSLFSHTHGHLSTLRFTFSQFFLDPADVTDRIMTVVKNFDKVDAEKVRSCCLLFYFFLLIVFSCHILTESNNLPSLKVTPTSVFSDDLGLDSLDAVEVVMAIEDEFVIEIPDAEADKIASIEDAVKYIASHPQAK